MLDPEYGLMVNPDLEQYKIAGSREIPEIDVQLVEAYIGQSSTDASGIGEAAGIMSIGAAIGNAVYNATGVRIRQTPMTPAVVLAALRSLGAGKGAGMNSFSIADCTSVDAALSQLKDGAVVKAGGVDLLDRMKDGIQQPTRLVNIRNVASLRGIRETDKGLTIGPLTTLAEISDHPRSFGNAIRFCPMPVDTLQRRTSAIWPPSAATCCSTCSAGITVPRIFSASARARNSASLSKA